MPQALTKIFPLGIAQGSAFCNRTHERLHLNTNIQDCRHTLLLSPRRYGKTSLVLQVAHEQKYLFNRTDFLLASDDTAVEDLILNCVSTLVAQILPLHKKALDKLGKFLSLLKPELSITKDGLKVKLSPMPQPRQSIVEALLALDKLAAAEKKTAVIIMDEFQQIATLKNYKTLEAAIRHAAEQAKHITYVFSGSNRHLLLTMFDESTRPLYNLCEKLTLQRIDYQDYHKFLKKAARKQWNATLDDTVITEICNLTHRHSYYINVLCSRLWRAKNPPKIQVVQQTWLEYANDEKRGLTSELSRLSPNQRAVITALAKTPAEHPTSKDSLIKVRLSPASNQQAITALINKDMVFKDCQNLYRPLNPVIEYIIKN